MTGGHDLGDAEWAVISPLCPDKPRGLPPVDDRRDGSQDVPSTFDPFPFQEGGTACGTMIDSEEGRTA